MKNTLRAFSLALGCLLLSPLAGSGATRPAAVVFLSDFGLADDAVSQCKGAMQTVTPGVNIVDLTHNVPPYDIRLAAFYLADSAAVWPKGTVFVAVVDPGVGTARKALALKTRSGQFFVGPDNGVFTLAIRRLGLEKAVSIEDKAFMRGTVTTTFHGRDIYAPAAARLARDPAALNAMGPEVRSPVMAEWPAASANPASFEGSVMRVESPYGNIWTDIDAAAVKLSGIIQGSTLTVLLGGRTLEVPFVSTFGDVPENSPLAYLNSRGLFSLALNMGDFGKTYGIKEGQAVSVTVSTLAFVDPISMSGGLLIPDIRYATPNNFTGKTVYPAARCLLRVPSALAVVAAAKRAAAAPEPFSLCMLDCYRPLSVQKTFWKIMPDERFVADPAKGSKHNRGLAVDLSACDKNGKWLNMPTGYDDFTERAGRNYKDWTPEQRRNSKKLEDLMETAGFKGLPSEWWHYDFPGWETTPVDDFPLPSGKP